jgi:hypothetical protein
MKKKAIFITLGVLFFRTISFGQERPDDLSAAQITRVDTADHIQ